MAPQQPDLLQGLASDEVARVRALGTRATFARGSAVFRLGDAANELFLVERGLVNLTLPIRIGGRQEDVLVEERQPGQMLGWSALVPPHLVTLDATTPVETELIAFPRARLLEYFAARPEVGCAILTNVSTIIGHRLQVLQAMWLREMQRLVALQTA